MKQTEPQPVKKPSAKLLRMMQEFDQKIRAKGPEQKAAIMEAINKASKPAK